MWEPNIVYLQQHWIWMNINNFNNVCNIYVRTHVSPTVCVYVYLSYLYWIRFLIADKFASIVPSPYIDVCGELNTCKSNKLFYLSLSITCLLRYVVKMPSYLFSLINMWNILKWSYVPHKRFIVSHIELSCKIFCDLINSQ